MPFAEQQCQLPIRRQSSDEKFSFCFIYNTYIYQPLLKQLEELSAKIILPSPREAVLPWKQALVTLLREILAKNQLFCQFLHRSTALLYPDQPTSPSVCCAVTSLLVLKLTGLQLHITACAASPQHSQWKSLVT